MSWTVVYSSLHPHLIEIAKSILAENGIKCVAVDKTDSMYKPISEPGIELYVDGKDFIMTKKLLSELEGE